VRVSSGTANLNGFITSSNLNLTAGTLAGTNVMAGTLTLSGGTFSGNMTVSNNSTLNLTASGGNLFFNAGTLTNNGTINWTNTLLFMGVGTTIYNHGLWLAQSDNSLQGDYNGGPATLIYNSGTFRKTGNLGSTTLDVYAILNNSGTVDVESGDLALGGEGTNSGAGTFNAATGASLVFNGGYTFGNGATFTGGGSVQLAGGTATALGAITAANLTVTGGTLTGTNTLAGTLTLSGGFLEGNMTINNGSILNISANGGNAFLETLTLTNNGTVNWTNAILYTGQGSVIYNYGAWNLQSDDPMYGNYDGNPGTIFNNFGTFRKTGNTGTTSLDGAVTFDNTGVVNIQSGSLSIYTLNSTGGAFTGNGMTLLEGSASTLNGTITTSNLFLETGTLTGTNVILGTLTLGGGTVSGTMTVSNNSILDLTSLGNNVFFNALTLTNNGTILWSNTPFYTGAGTLIYNNGLWLAETDNNMAGNYNGNPGTVIQNAGTFRKTGTTGTTALDNQVTLNNTGTLDVETGTFSTGAGGTNSASVINVATGATINFSGGYTFTNSTDFTGGGDVLFPNGAVFYGTITSSNLSLMGGTFSGTNVLVGSLTVSGGTLTGSMLVSNGSVFNLAGAGNNVFFYALSLTNKGTFNWTNTAFYTGAGCVIYNYGSWLAQSDNTMAGNYNGNPGTVFDNFGLFAKTGNSGSTTLDNEVTLINLGIVNVQSGTLRVNATGTNTAGGSFGVTTGATLDFAGGFSFPTNAVFAGGGNVILGNGAVFYGTIAATNLSLTGGTLSGSNVLVGTLNLSGGTLTGSMTVSNGSVFNLNAQNNNVFFYALTLTNDGTVTWSNTPLYTGAGSLIYNNGLWLAQTDNNMAGNYNGNPGTIFDNAGIFRKTGSTGSTTLDSEVTVTNTGTLDAQLGNISIGGPVSLTNGILNAGINSSSSYGTIILAGTAPLTGTISLNLNSNYVPLVNAAFPVVTFPFSTGSFTSNSFPSLAVWQTGYNPANVTITLLKWVPHITWANPANITYGTLLSGTQLDATAASPTNLGGNLAGAFVYSPPSGTALFASNNQVLSVTFNPADLVNYTNVGASALLNVAKAALTVTATNQSKTYGQTRNFAGTEFTTSGLQFSDTVTGVTLTSAGTPPTAGVAGSPYTITNSAATGTGLVNYIISHVNGSLTVNPAPLTVTANAENKTYGQVVGFGPGSGLFGGSALQNGESIGTVTLACAGGIGTASVAGSPYTITPSAATGGTFTPGNYSITYNTGLLTVNKAPLSVMASPENKNYGQGLFFGSGSTLFSSSSLSNSETIGTVTLAVSGNGGAPTASVAGSPYTITPSGATGGTFTPGNYNITYNPGNLTVNQAPLTIAAIPQTNTYGQTLSFGAGSLLFTSSVLSNNETIGTVTLAVSGNGGAPTAPVAGTPYTITPSAATGGTFTPGNYNINYKTAYLTVNPALLTVTASPQSKTYGQTLSFGPGSALFGSSTLANGETIGSVTLAVSGNGGAATATVAGSPYTITPSAATAGTFNANNYAITYVTNLLTVNQTNLTITANNRTKTYGQTVVFAGTEFTDSTLLNGDTITGVTLSSAGAAANASLSGSPYQILPSLAVGSGLGNYNISGLGVLEKAARASHAEATHEKQQGGKQIRHPWPRSRLSGRRPGQAGEGDHGLHQAL
jgi:hypothetical protein